MASTGLPGTESLTVRFSTLGQDFLSNQTPKVFASITTTLMQLLCKVLIKFGSFFFPHYLAILQ